jgi:hypothetical protein
MILMKLLDNLVNHKMNYLNKNAGLIILTSVVFLIAVEVISIFDLSLYSSIEKIISERSKDFYIAVSAIGGSLLGFIIAGISILVALPAVGIIAVLMKKPAYRQLFEYFHLTSSYLSFLTVFSLLGIILNLSPDVSKVIFYISLILLFWTSFLVGKSVRLLGDLISLHFNELQQLAQSGSDEQNTMAPTRLPSAGSGITKSKEDNS